MRSIPTALQACLEERPYDIVELLEMVDLQGNTIRLTNNGETLFVTSSAAMYVGLPGFDRSEITYELGGNPAVTDITVPIGADQLITPLQIERGLWRRSTVQLWMADRTDPDSSVLLFRGYVGKTSTTDGVLGRLEVASLSEKNSDIVLPKVAAACNYVFGGGYGTPKGCRVNVSALAVYGTVDAVVVPRRTFTVLISDSDAADFTNGALRFGSGDNHDVAGQVRLWDGDTAMMELLRPMPFTISSGDAFAVHPGCKRTLTDCTRFGGLSFWPGYAWAPGENGAG
jgi:uncharacterized phage protein (TIGR02218 family)